MEKDKHRCFLFFFLFDNPCLLQTFSSSLSDFWDFHINMNLIVGNVSLLELLCFALFLYFEVTCPHFVFLLLSAIVCAKPKMCFICSSMKWFNFFVWGKWSKWNALSLSRTKISTSLRILQKTEISDFIEVNNDKQWTWFFLRTTEDMKV